MRADDGTICRASIQQEPFDRIRFQRKGTVSPNLLMPKVETFYFGTRNRDHGAQDKEKANKAQKSARSPCPVHDANSQQSYDARAKKAFHHAVNL